MTVEHGSQLRSLLVALDTTPASGEAQRLALALAGKFNASLTGITILDKGFLTAPEPVAIGASHYKLQADRARLQQARDRNDRLTKGFRDLCQSASTNCDILNIEGDPKEELAALAATHDLVVIGRDSDFHGDLDPEPAKTVRRILEDSPRPLIVAPPQATRSARTIVAYDASVAAARALQLFVLLGLAHGSEIHIVSVASRQYAAERHAQHAATFLGRHGVTAMPRPIVSSADPADIVIGETRAIDAGLVMMGAYGHRGWRETLLGSFTTHLLSKCPTALFIHH